MSTLDELREGLIARLSAGEPIDPEQIVPELRDDPGVVRLLRLSRVFGALMRSPDADVAPLPESAVLPPLIGPYRIVRSLGRGGMGEVWLGERVDGTVEQRVAIKRVRGDLQSVQHRLRDEWRILARLDHPNVARFVDAGIDDYGHPWLALEYVEGRTITEWCRQEQPSLERRLRLLLKVCAAVEHAHQHLVVHRDLKPNNVLVTEQSEPKLLDFGIAKLLDGSDSEQTTGALTPSYAAPEQLRGAGLSTLTDVYSLGLLMFRVLAGARPRTRSGETSLVLLDRLDDEERERPSARIAAAEFPPPYPASALRGDLDAVVAQAIRAVPEARYPSARAVADDIERFLSAHPVQARRAGMAYRFARFSQRHRTALALSLVALLLLIGSSVISLRLWWRAENEAQSAKMELTRSERLSEFLVSLFREQDPMHRDRASARPPADVLSEAAERVERELEDDPLVQVKLMRVLAEGQLNLGELPAATRIVEHAAGTLSTLAPEPLLQAELDTLRGRLALKQLDNAAAERWFGAALETASRERGGDSIEVARVEAQHALALVVGGQFKEARAAAEVAQRIFSEQLGGSAAESLQSLYVLGVIQEQLRDDEAALDSLGRAMTGFEALYGDRDAHLVGVLQSLGEVLRRRADYSAARAALERAVTIGRERYGQRHPLVAQALAKLAATEIAASRRDVALQVLNEAEQAVAEGDLSAHAQVLATRGHLYLENEAEAAAAERDLRASLRLRRETSGDRNPIAWFNQAELAVAVAIQGRHAEAEGLVLEARRALPELLGPDAYQNALLAQRVSRVYALAGAWPKSADAMRDAIRITEKVYGEGHFLSFNYRLVLLDRLVHIAAAHSEALALANALQTQWGERPEARSSMADLSLAHARLLVTAGQIAEARSLVRTALSRGDWIMDEATRTALQSLAAD